MQNGMDFLKMVEEEHGGKSVEETADALFLDPKDVRRYLKAATFFSGDLREPAERSNLPVGSLQAIAGQVNKLGKKYAQRNELALQLLQDVQGKSIPDALQVCRAAVEQRVAKEGLKRTVESVKIQREPNVFGQRHFNMVLNESTVDAILNTLGPAAWKVRKQRDCSFPAAWAQVVVEKLLATEAADAPQQEAKPCFLIALDDPHYYDDGIIATASGATITWEEAVNTRLAKEGYVLVAAKQADGGYPMAARYDIERFASPEQRFIAGTETLTCPWIDCDRAAAECQTHHIEAYSRGGRTIQTNLTPACITHNSANDDNPNRRRNGRLERCKHTGRIGWKTPLGELRFNEHRRKRKGWREFANRQLGF